MSFLLTTVMPPFPRYCEQALLPGLAEASAKIGAGISGVVVTQIAVKGASSPPVEAAVASSSDPPVMWGE